MEKVQNRKWRDPIDQLLDADHKAKNFANYIGNNESIANMSSEKEIIYLDPKQIILWKYKDRPENELGDIDLLAKKMQDIGQQQPCIVRPHHHKQNYYELVAGERRWRAAVKAAIPLSVIVKNLSDNEAAIVQEEENSYNPLSEYAQGMSYAKQIKDGVLQQVDLIEKLGISKQKLSRLLSYSHIPEDVSIAIRDFRKVSSGTAEKIKQLCNKGEAYTNCIIDLAEKIRLGKIGHEKLTKIVEERIHNKAKKKIKKIYDQNGNFLFTIKQTDHHGITINVKKETINLLNNRILSHALFSNKMIEVLQNVS